MKVASLLFDAVKVYVPFMLLQGGVAAGFLAASPRVARAQVGEQPVRIVFPFTAGGSGDALARLLGNVDRPAAPAAQHV